MADGESLLRAPARPPEHRQGGRGRIQAVPGRTRAAQGGGVSETSPGRPGGRRDDRQRKFSIQFSNSQTVIASEAKQSIKPRKGKNGLLRRFAPRNDGPSHNTP